MADLEAKIDLPTLHHDQDEHNVANIDVSNTGAFAENAAISVAPGIAPVADYIPKDATTSHPTPPPDEPLATSEANVDVEMKADEVPKVESVSEPQSAVSEPPVAPVVSLNDSSLVRPREDDDDGEDLEPAAKRTRVDGDLDEDVTLPDAPPADATTSTPPQPEAAESSIPTADASQGPAAQSQSLPAPVEASDPVSEPQSAPEEPPSADAAMDIEPSATPAAPESSTETEALQAADSSAAPLQNGVHAPVASTETVEPAAPKPVDAEAKLEDSQPVQAPVQGEMQPPPTAPSKPTYSRDPLTQPQTRYLLEKMKNLKKTKHSLSFLNPVDYVALNIPTYPDIIKTPMDLGTMENKMKTGKYGSVQEFVDDFNLIIQNARTFNGDAHPVTQAGFSMEAYMKKILEGVPSANQPAPQKPQPKKASPKPQPRRESRSVAQAAPAPAAAAAAATAAPANTAESFALQPDGTPQIRRDSTINRPARAIKPPPARELTYSKPKRKEHQLELKFCDHVLSEVKGPKYAALNSVFLSPVDPVALNIPHYRQVVKHPMDLSTMTQKLRQGQYGKASEFKKDFELMIQNCLVFNPIGNPVRDMGVQFKREFDALWQTKDKWEKARKAELQRGTSASADEYSGDEEEEDEDEGPDDDKTDTIARLQKQLEQIQGALAGLNQPAPKKKSSSKKAAKPNKKSGGGSAQPKQKLSTKPKAPKKPKQVTYEEKQEISDAVGRMNEEQVGQLTKIITSNCKKYADQEEMELEIDDLPNDVQAMLLTFVRSIFGNPTRGARAVSPDDAAALDDDDFEPTERGGRRGGGGGSKRKKHKPMHKDEQQKAINDIKSQLAQFQNVTSASPSQQEDTSGDESEESEEE